MELEHEHVSCWLSNQSDACVCLFVRACSADDKRSYTEQSFYFPQYDPLNLPDRPGTVFKCVCRLPVDLFRIYIVHDEVKDKAFELELSWVGESKKLLFFFFVLFVKDQRTLIFNNHILSVIQTCDTSVSSP